MTAEHVSLSWCTSTRALHFQLVGGGFLRSPETSYSIYTEIQGLQVLGLKALILLLQPLNL